MGQLCVAKTGTVRIRAIAMPTSPTMADRRAGIRVEKSWAIAAANAVVPTTAPPNTRLWTCVCWAANEG